MKTEVAGVVWEWVAATPDDLERGFKYDGVLSYGVGTAYDDWWLVEFNEGYGGARADIDWTICVVKP